LILEWLVELGLEPSFPAERLRWLRRHAAAELRAQLDQPEVRTAQAFLRQLYGDHPYGRPLIGDGTNLRRISQARCRRFFAQAWQSGGVLAVAGELDSATTLRRLERLLTGRVPPPGASALPALAPPTADTTTIELKNADQAHLYAGHLTVDRRHPDLPALEVLAVILGAGAGLAGRLPTRIRDREGLAYSADVATTAGAGLLPGRFAVYVGTAPANLVKVEAVVREELQNLLEGGVSASEFEEARAYLLGREPFRQETLRQKVDLMADALLYDQPTDRAGYVTEVLRDLTHAEVEAALRRWIRPDELQITIGRPRPV
jgi:zinc protease